MTMAPLVATWYECLKLYTDLQNGKPGISDRIKEVDHVHFHDFVTSFTLLDPSKQKEEIQAVKTVVEKIKHLKKCSTGNMLDDISPFGVVIPDFISSVSDHYQILGDIFENVKIDQLDVSFTKFFPNCVFHIIQWCKVSEVKSLALRRCALKPDHLFQLRKTGSHFKLKLQELNVSYNTFSPDDMKMLVSICDVCVVESLKLERCFLNLEHLVQFTKAYRGIKLVELDISENDNICKRNALSGLARLISTEECVSQLVKLCEIYQLEKLCMRFCGLKSDQITKFIKLAKNAEIVEMDIQNNPDIDDRTESKLLQFLEHNKPKVMWQVSEHIQKEGTSSTTDDKESLFYKSDDKKKRGKVERSDLAQAARASGTNISDNEAVKNNMGMESQPVPATKELVFDSEEVEIPNNDITENFPAPVITAVSFDPSDVKRIERKIKENLSAPVIRGELIGPEGISINVLDCISEYPSNAFHQRTPVLHSVSSAYDDVPDGFVACSPELECDTFGVPVQGTVTVTLPLHDLPEDGQVVIFKKTESSVVWETVNSFPYNDDKKTVTFPTGRFSRLKACCLKFLRRKTLLSQYLFYKPGTLQLSVLTCLDNKAVKNKCVTSYSADGFIKSQPLPERIRLYKGERLSYKYKCVKPEGTVLRPECKVVLSRKDISKYFQQWFTLRCREQLGTIGSVTIRYSLTTPQRANKKSEISMTLNALAERKNYSSGCVNASNISSHPTAASTSALGNATSIEENVLQSATTTAVSGHATAARGIALIHSTGARRIICQATPARETTVGSITLGHIATSGGNMSGQTTTAVGSVLVHATALGGNTMGQTITAGGSTMSHTNNAGGNTLVRSTTAGGNTIGQTTTVGGNTLGQNITAGGAALVQTTTAGENALIQTPAAGVVALVHATTAGKNLMRQTTTAGGNTLGQITTAGGNMIGQTTTSGGNTMGHTTTAGGNTMGQTTNSGGNTMGQTTTAGGNTLGQITTAGGNTMAQTTTAGGNTMAQTTTAGGNTLISATVSGGNTSAAAVGSALGGAIAHVQELNIRTCTREFYERHLTDEEIYPFELNCIKGKVLIINNQFEGNEELEREGSEIDVENLQMLWTAIGFEVDVRRNLTAAGMRLSIGEFARSAVNVSSVFLIIMSHGGRSVNGEFICGEDMGRVPTENIISFFTSQNSPHLRGIPKVFMFQACRGNLRDRADAGSFEEPRRRRTPDRADMLIAYPCQSGNVSFRNSVTGSWLMNEVTKIFRSRAHDSDLLAMLTMVNKEIAKNEGQFGDMQSSNQETYLRRKLYLFPGWPN